MKLLVTLLALLFNPLNLSAQTEFKFKDEVQTELSESQSELIKAQNQFNSSLDKRAYEGSWLHQTELQQLIKDAQLGLEKSRAALLSARSTFSVELLKQNPNAFKDDVKEIDNADEIFSQRKNEINEAERQMAQRLALILGYTAFNETLKTLQRDKVISNAQISNSEERVAVLPKEWSSFQRKLKSFPATQDYATESKLKTTQQFITVRFFNHWSKQNVKIVFELNTSIQRLSEVSKFAFAEDSLGRKVVEVFSNGDYPVYGSRSNALKNVLLSGASLNSKLDPKTSTVFTEYGLFNVEYVKITNAQ